MIPSRFKKHLWNRGPDIYKKQPLECFIFKVTLTLKVLNLPKSNHGISETPHSNAGFEKTMSVSTDDDDTANDAETEPKRNRPKEDLQVVELDGSIGRSQRSTATFRCALEYMDPGGMARSWWVDYWRVKSKTLIQKKGKLKKGFYF